MAMGMNWTRTSYLFLVVILISVGITSAYAISITLAADPVFVKGDLIVDGDLDLAGLSDTDDDTIFFDGIFEGTKTFQWDDSDARFEISDDLALAGTIQTGNIFTAPVLYNRMGNAIAQATGGPITNTADLFVSGDLEVGGELYILGPDSTSSDLIFFDQFEGPSFGWDETDDRFEFSDGVAINNGNLDVSGFNPNDDDIIFFDEGTFTTLQWDNSEDQFEFSKALQVNGNLDIFEGSITATGPGDLTINGLLNLGPPNTRTIASGVVNVFDTILTVAAESTTVDDLDTINGGTTGDFIIIKADTLDTITVTNNGNILLVGFSDIILDNDDRAIFIFDGTNWIELLRVNHD